MAHVTPQRWFLPETPDVLGQLREQLRVTVEGVDRFALWARGERVGVAELRAIEARGDEAKRRLLELLREAFVTPLEPEDLFMLSRDIDWILNRVGDLAAESEVLRVGPDAEISEMAELLARAVRDLDRALAEISSSPESATAAADAAIATFRTLQATYYRCMAASLESTDRGERVGRRELYRRCLEIGQTVVDVAERTVYAVVKQS